MNDDEKARYTGYFETNDVNKDGFVESKEAVGLFEKSGLPKNHLKVIWAIADQDRDNKLSVNEFIIAMHLIVCVSKRGLPLPTKLPEELTTLPPPKKQVFVCVILFACILYIYIYIYIMRVYVLYVHSRYI